MKTYQRLLQLRTQIHYINTVLILIYFLDIYYFFYKTVLMSRIRSFMKDHFFLSKFSFSSNCAWCAASIDSIETVSFWSFMVCLAPHEANTNTNNIIHSIFLHFYPFLSTYNMVPRRGFEPPRKYFSTRPSSVRVYQFHHLGKDYCRDIVYIFL